MQVGTLDWSGCHQCLNYTDVTGCMEDVDYSDLLFVDDMIVCELGEQQETDSTHEVDGERK